MDVQKAKELLQSANRNFLDIGAYSRAKDVLYLRVSVNYQYLVALQNYGNFGSGALNQLKRLILNLCFFFRHVSHTHLGTFKKEIKFLLSSKNQKNNIQAIQIQFQPQCYEIYEKGHKDARSSPLNLESLFVKIYLLKYKN